MKNRSVSLLVKPASSLCNLRCGYCFYHSLSARRQTASHGVMRPEVLEAVVARALEGPWRSCGIAFQGGEPALAGLGFYRELLRLEEARNARRIPFTHSMQTNGTLLDGEWAAFLAEHRFLTGLSLDGPKDLHDANRTDGQGRGSWSGAMRAASLLAAGGVETNILCVVNGRNARHAGRLYRFFRAQGFRYLQFIPCLDPLDGPPGEASLTSARYAQFLMALFDLWHEDVLRGDGISIRYFDNLVQMAAGYEPEACGMGGACACQFVVEADGSVYPCDFYAEDRWRLGNVLENSLEQMAGSETAREFIRQSLALNGRCGECRWFALCRGGCRRWREPLATGGPDTHCEAYREFFGYAGDRIAALARRFFSSPPSSL